MKPIRFALGLGLGFFLLVVWVWLASNRTAQPRVKSGVTERDSS